MLDGDTTTGGWSNAFRKDATALLFAEDRARPSDWVSVRWPTPQRFGNVKAYFTIGTVHARPAAVRVSYWDGRSFVLVGNPTVDWAGTSNAPTGIAFDPVTTTEIRLELTSALPNQPNGHIQIAELEIGTVQVRPQ